MRILLVLFIALFISCKTYTDKDIPAKAFNDRLSGYLLNLDGSEVLDHPYRMYFNCSESGYYAIHYVPKTMQLQNYWSTCYFEENKYESDDLRTENQLISNLLNPIIKEYNVFLYYVSMQDLDTTYGCTQESIQIKPGAKGYVYIKVNSDWKYLSTDMTPDIPIYYPSDYFTTNFPEYFK